jgi:hypothetical protein
MERVGKDFDESERKEIKSEKYPEPFDKRWAKKTRRTPRERWWWIWSPRLNEAVVGSIPMLHVRFLIVG